ncbi:hypothetical protein F4809DRAFT_278233 [Biscogniauxia mediterranea]|nr:hypothetical protein F4809DRAFT_278233 [Biscogniauxia mediterranea]
MASWTAFLLVYLFGGITFIPLLVIAVLVHAHLTFPVRADPDPGDENGADSIIQPGDDLTELRAAQKEDSKQKLIAESSVATGYFAVCREYTPMGINAKPIERSTPVGSTTIAAPSPSVYQTMYRSIFDRKHSSSPLDEHKTASQRPKRAGNVFFVVLRHGHLMLFDDDEQIEVRHVISLAHHNISIYSGGDRTPEGELYIKRSALCLTRRTDGKELTPDAQISKPFYLFTENCSAKEDFYFALLRNQEQSFATQNLAPKPQRFEVKNIISLVQKLHSSDEYVQTRWLNALLGRMFLGIYKTKDIENQIREKITKKISRVNRPSFLTRIAIQNIDTGDSAPLITNPQLKNLNVDGECVMEADVKYTGNFRLEVAATARIDLGSRFKAREVNLILAVVLRRLEGHVLFKIKPPPSNRLWFSFQSMPKMETTIEPIVSSRQITYTVILRQIENRIKEVVAETLVAPFWDDIPFFNTEHKQWRGGIFEGDDVVEHAPDHETIAAQLGNVDEVSHMEESAAGSSTTPELPQIEKSQTMPMGDNNQSTGFWGRRLNSKKPTHINGNQSASASTTALDLKNSSPSSAAEIPRRIRTGSFSASSPIVSTDPTHADTFRPSSTPPDRDDAISMMASISSRSPNNSPIHSPAGSPSKSSSSVTPGNLSSNSSSEAIFGSQSNQETPVAQRRRHTTSSRESVASDSIHSSQNSVKSGTSSIGRGLFGRKDMPSPTIPNPTTESKRNTLTAMSNAAATAKRWGLNALQRQADRSINGRKLSDPHVDLNQPMGRGQPLPPPGTPLPGPGQKATPMQVVAPKRKPLSVPPPTRYSNGHVNETNTERRPVPAPPLPRRRRISQIHSTEGINDNIVENVLIVEAPEDSETNSPSPGHLPNYVQPWVEDAEELDESSEMPVLEEQSGGPPELPPRPASIGQHQDAGGWDQKAMTEDDDEDYSNWIDTPEFKQDVAPNEVDADADNSSKAGQEQVRILTPPLD